MSKVASSSSSRSPSCAAPEGAACWLCLEEGPDESGAPLVRDCSCRGHSGYAHLPCIVKYAESRSRDFAERRTRGGAYDDNIFKEKFFLKCPNCKQEFQGDIYNDMTKAQLSFIEREFKEETNWHVEAMVMRMTVLNAKKDADRIEGEEIRDKILTMIEDDMGNSKPSVDIETLTMSYKFLGTFHFHIGTDESLEKAKKYYEKARDVCNTLPQTETVIFMTKSIEEELAQIEALKNGRYLPKHAGMDLRRLQDTYKHLCQNVGENDIVTIQCGVHLAKALFETYQTIEALRLLDELLLTSRRVHGPGHKQTKSAESVWQQMKFRYVSVKEQPYQALRYKKNGDSYVVRGPLPKKGNLVGELRSGNVGTTFSVPSADIILGRGAPVVLRGLKKAAHLNGEIGEIRDLCPLSNRCVVHLEGKASKPVKVKQENLRILFNLPDPKKESGAP